MPVFKSEIDGKEYTIEEWKGASHKAKVINKAYRNGNFTVQTIVGSKVTMFKCEYCGNFITSAGVEGGHGSPQKLKRSANREERALFEGDDLINLSLVCSECNKSENSTKIMTRKRFRDAREKTKPY